MINRTPPKNKNPSSSGKATNLNKKEGKEESEAESGRPKTRSSQAEVRRQAASRKTVTPLIIIQGEPEESKRSLEKSKNKGEKDQGKELMANREPKQKHSAKLLEIPPFNPQRRSTKTTQEQEQTGTNPPERVSSFERRLEIQEKKLGPTKQLARTPVKKAPNVKETVDLADSTNLEDAIASDLEGVEIEVEKADRQKKPTAIPTGDGLVRELLEAMTDEGETTDTGVKQSSEKIPPNKNSTMNKQTNDTEPIRSEEEMAKDSQSSGGEIGKDQREREENKKRLEENEAAKIAEKSREEAEEKERKQMIEERQQGYIDHIYECKKALYGMMHHWTKKVDYKEFRDYILELNGGLGLLSRDNDGMDDKTLKRTMTQGEQCREKALVFLVEKFEVNATIDQLLTQQSDEKNKALGVGGNSNSGDEGDVDSAEEIDPAEQAALNKIMKERDLEGKGEEDKKKTNPNERKQEQALGSSLPTNIGGSQRPQAGAFSSMNDLAGNVDSDSSSTHSKGNGNKSWRDKKNNGFRYGKPNTNKQQSGSREGGFQPWPNSNYKGRNYDPNYHNKFGNRSQPQSRSNENDRGMPPPPPPPAGGASSGGRSASESRSWSGSGSTSRGSSARMNDLRTRFDQAKEQTKTIKKEHQGEVVFPNGWEIPTAGEFEDKGFLPINFTRDIEKHLIKPFSGYVEDYFRFRETFYKCIHVQQVATFYKVMALDQLIKNPKTQAMLSDLGTSDQAYADRIQRLEEAFGDEDKYQNHLLTSLTELRQFSANDETAVARFSNLLRTYLNMASPLEAANIPLRQLLKTRWPREWLKDYGMYRARTSKADDLITVCEFAAEAHETLQKSQEDLKFERELKATYQRGAGPSNATQKASNNYQTKTMVWEPEEEVVGQDSYYEQETEYVEGRGEYAFQAYSKRPDNQRKKECWLCEVWDHDIHNCEEFHASSSQEKRDSAWKNKVCFVCLLTGHGSRQCWSKVKCKFPKCGERHHYMLHPKSGQERPPKKTPPKDIPKKRPNAGNANTNKAPETKESAAGEAKLVMTEVHESVEYYEPEYYEIQHLHAESEHEVYNVMCEHESTEYYEVDGIIYAKTAEGKTEIALTILAIEITNERTGKKEYINVLIDSGANGNALDLAVAQALGLTGKKKPYLVKVAGGGYKEHIAFEAEVSVKGLSRDCPQNKHLISVQCYDQPCNIKGIDWKFLHERWPFLKNLHLPQLRNGRRVDMIIGTKNIELMVPSKITKGKVANGPIAQLTELGWIVAGNTGIPKGNRADMNSLCQETTSKTLVQENKVEEVKTPESTPVYQRTPNEIRAAGTGEIEEEKDDATQSKGKLSASNNDEMIQYNHVERTYEESSRKKLVEKEQERKNKEKPKGKKKKKKRKTLFRDEQQKARNGKQKKKRKTLSNVKRKENETSQTTEGLESNLSQNTSIVVFDDSLKGGNKEKMMTNGTESDSDSKRSPERKRSL